MPTQSSILKTETARIRTAFQTSLSNLQPVFPDSSKIEIVSQLLAEMGFGSAMPTPNSRPTSKKSYVVSAIKSKKGIHVTPGAFKKGISNSEAVLEFAKNKRTFSSKEAQEHFKATPEKMAGSLASLTRQGLLRKLDDKAEDGTNLWRFGKRKN